MKFTRFLSAERPSQALNPCWGGLQRLIVLIATRDDSNDSVIAYGVDPDHVDPDHDSAVFELFVPSVQIGTFFQRIVDGQPFRRAIDERHANSVDVTPAQPPTQGPRMVVVLAYAAALRIDEKFAQLGPFEIPDDGGSDSGGGSNGAAEPASDQPNL